MSDRERAIRAKLAGPPPALRLSSVACPRCLALMLTGDLRAETVQRLPRGAFAPLARDGSGPCCYDCAHADGLMRVVVSKPRTGRIAPAFDFVMARIAVANERQEQYRAPGLAIGLVGAGLVRPSSPGDFEEHLAWLDTQAWWRAAEQGSHE